MRVCECVKVEKSEKERIWGGDRGGEEKKGETKRISSKSSYSDGNERMFLIPQAISTCRRPENVSAKMW